MFEEVRTKLQGYHGFLCTLGSRTKYGKQEFVKVDYTYPLEFAKVAVDLQIPYFGLLSSVGASASSWFLYMKTKGEIENAITALKLPYLCIFRPGLLRNRDNDARFGEKIAHYIPFLGGIESVMMGAAMLKHVILRWNSGNV